MSSDSRNISKCYSTKLKFCRGTILDPLDQYTGRAYWCGKVQKGWSAQPCDCKSKEQPSTKR